MLSKHIVLPGSRDFKAPSKSCVRCGQDKTASDGVEMGPKFYCGTCWRKNAPRGVSGLARLSASRGKK